MNRLIGTRNGKMSLGADQPPSPNGGNGCAVHPSPNGGNGLAKPPSPNGDNGAAAPKCPPPATPGKGRDADGRFAVGWRGGPGNPFARRVAELRRLLLGAVSDEALLRIVRDLVDMAQKRDLAAMKLLFAYLIGRPAEAVDPDTLDLKEWQLFQRTPVRLEDMTRMLESLPTSFACEVVRVLLPFTGRRWAERYAKELKLDEPAASKEKRSAAGGRKANEKR